MIKDERCTVRIPVSPGVPEEYIKQELARARRRMVEELFERGLYNHRMYAFQIEEIPPHPMEYAFPNPLDPPAYVIKLNIHEVTTVENIHMYKNDPIKYDAFTYTETKKKGIIERLKGLFR